MLLKTVTKICMTQIKNVPQAIKLADAAMKACGITPNHKPIRGGTDGAFLAEKD